jgi:hypothetical protein
MASTDATLFLKLAAAAKFYAAKIDAIKEFPPEFIMHVIIFTTVITTVICVIVYNFLFIVYNFIAKLMRTRQAAKINKLDAEANKKSNLSDTNDECPICKDKPLEVYWGCGHCYCTSCTGEIRTCAFCRREKDKLYEYPGRLSLENFALSFRFGKIPGVFLNQIILKG